MSSFTKLTYHVVFSTKHRTPAITEDLRVPLYEYIGGIVRAIQGSLLEIGGVEDHVHLLVRLPPVLAVSGAIRDTKANASKWINSRGDQRERFEWQKGYSAFSVSYSQIETVRKYIRNQREHHRKRTFQEEYLAMLRCHDIQFDPRYVFEEEYSG